MEKDVNLLEEWRNLNDLENNLYQLDGLLKGFVPLLTKNKEAMLNVLEALQDVGGSKAVTVEDLSEKLNHLIEELNDDALLAYLLQKDLAPYKRKITKKLREEEKKWTELKSAHFIQNGLRKEESSCMSYWKRMELLQ